jgi:hypothetical protein
VPEAIAKSVIADFRAVSGLKFAAIKIGAVGQQFFGLRIQRVIIVIPKKVGFGSLSFEHRL